MGRLHKVIEKLDKMEKTLNDLAINEKESASEVRQPLAIMKNDWEPFIKLKLITKTF